MLLRPVASTGSILAGDRRWRRWTLLLALLVLPALVSGCGPGQPSRWNLHSDVRRPQPGVVIFLVDGLPPGFVERGCTQGWLPHIQQQFREGGAVVRRAATCVPSITYAAITSMLTGVGPSRHRITGNRWFDPETALFRNYVEIEHYRDVNADFVSPTLYELIRPAASASIQAAHVRGASLDVANWAPSGVRWFFGDFTAVDKLTVSSFWRVTSWANLTRRWPSVLTCYFPGLDTIGHRYGAHSQRFRAAAEHIDYQIGRACEWLERQGLLETTYLVLISDHGMTDGHPQNHIDLLRLVRNEWGRSATREMLQGGLECQRRSFYDRFDTVINDQDGRRASLHFRAPAGWRAAPAPELVESILTAPPVEQQLWNLHGVELVANLAAPDRAVIRSARGRAEIVAGAGRAGPEYAYVPQPDDVLGYLEDPDVAAFVGAGFHASREWLSATADQLYPDVVPHLVPLLHVRRAGQVVLFARPGYSFVTENGGHGGIHRDDMRMTFMLAGPGIAPGTTIATARAVDLLPTVLDLLGVQPREDLCLEGMSLRDAGLFAGARGDGAP